MLARADEAALDGCHGSFAGADRVSRNAHRGLDRAVGGNIHLVATPDMIVDWFVRLEAAGVDGVQVSFYDSGPDLERLGCTVLPLAREAGLRHPEPVGPDTGSEA